MKETGSASAVSDCATVPPDPSPTVFQHGTRVCRCRFYWMHFRCPALPASLSLPAQGKFRDAGAIRSIADRLSRAEAEEPRGIRSRYLATELLLELSAQSADDKREDRMHSPPEKLCERIPEFSDAAQLRALFQRGHGHDGGTVPHLQRTAARNAGNIKRRPTQ